MSTSDAIATTDEQVGFQAHPLTTCPHCPQIGTPKTPIDINAPCSVCQNVGENMVCLTCFEVHCGRHVKAHMLDHHDKTSHPIVCGFADLTVWCYPCENYIQVLEQHVKPVHNQLYQTKFGEEDPWTGRFLVDDKKEEEKKAPATAGGDAEEKKKEPKFNKLFSTFDTQGVIDHILKNDCRRILVMTGAGISVAAGIPDFRTPGTGLYSNLAKYNLPYAEAVFTLDYLKKNPEVFFKVSKDMQLWPGSFAPTHVHHFIYQLQEHGRLLRAYTQNIDCLEREAGIDPELLVEAHGTFSAAHCIEAGCKAEADLVDIRKKMDEGEIPRCHKCQGIVKPDVVFFGEGLPGRFFGCLNKDVRKADLLIVIGTSMTVMPFGSIASMVDDDCPRVLINRDLVGNFKLHPSNAKVAAAAAAAKKKEKDSRSDSSSDDEETKEAAAINSLDEEQEGLLYRDIFLGGDCQAVARELAAGLGFEEKLEKRYAQGQQRVAESKKKAE